MQILLAPSMHGLNPAKPWTQLQHAEPQQCLSVGIRSKGKTHGGAMYKFMTDMEAS